MASPEVVMPAMGAIAALYCGPPFLVFIVCVRRRLRSRYFGRNSGGYSAGAAVAAVAFLFNLLVVLPTLGGLAGGSLRLTVLSLIGLSVSWICFWAWIVLTTVLRRKRRPAL
jgi:hypothetical protein